MMDFRTIEGVKCRWLKLITTVTATLVLVFILTVTPNPAHAQTEATVQGIIATLSDYFNDVPAYQSMTNDQKTEYILTQGRNRIVGRSLDLARSNLATYSEEVLRHRLMMKYINDHVAQQVFMTVVLEGEAAGKAAQAKLLLEGSQKVNLKLAALNIGAGLGVGAITGYLDSGMSGAFWGSTQAAGEAYMESVIPFYGWAKLVVGMEAALINWFKGYVKEQQVQCALDQIFGQGLMGQLASKTRAEVDRVFEEAWTKDEGVANSTCARYGYGAEGMTDPATGKPFPLFKNDVKLAVMNMKDTLDQKVKQAETTTKSIIEAERSNAENQAKAAEEKLKAAYEAAISPIKPALAKIDELRKAIPAATKTKAQETKAGVERAQSQIPVLTIPYAPLERNAILGVTTAMLSEIKDTPGAGYNYDNYLRLLSERNRTRADVIAVAAKRVADDIRACEKKANEALNRCTAINPRDESCWTTSEKACRNGNGQKLANDISILEQEEKILEAEAIERGTKLAIKIQEGIAKIGFRIRDADNTYKQKLAAFRTELNEKLGPLSGKWRGESVNPSVDFALGWSGVYNGLKDGTFRPIQPGHIIQSYNTADSFMQQVLQIQPLILALQQKEKAFYSEYETALILLRNQIQSLVPSHMLSGVTSDKQQWTIWCGFFCGYVNFTSPLELPMLSLSLDQLKRSLAEFEKSPMDLKDSLTYLQTALDTMRSDATLDELAVMINRASQVLVSALGSYRYAEKNDNALAHLRFHQRNGISTPDVTPDQSDGVVYLTAMKAAWEKNGAMLDKFVNWKKVYGKGLKYESGDPGPFLASLDSYLRIPEKIAMYEATMTTATVDRQKSTDQALQDLKKLQDQFAALATTGIMGQIQTPKGIILPALDWMIQSGVNMGNPAHVRIKDKIFAFKAEVEAYVAQKEKEWAVTALEQQRVQDEQRKNQIMLPTGGTEAERMAAYARATGLLSSAAPAPPTPPVAALPAEAIPALSTTLSSPPSPPADVAPPRAQESAPVASSPAPDPRLSQALIGESALLTPNSELQTRAEESVLPTPNSSPIPDPRPQAPASVPPEIASRIKDLYGDLKDGFESESAGGVTRCLTRGWTGTGGMDQGDLRKTLVHSFRDLQDVRCTIQGLRVEKMDEDSYKVTYDFALTAKGRKTKEKVEEKSTVTDEVSIEKRGKPKIAKTTSGRFWIGK